MHPIIGNMVGDNQEEFLQYIRDPQFLNNIVNPDIDGNLGDNPGNNNPVNGGNLLGQARVELSAEDQANIREIMEITFASFNEVLQYYVALDRDKDATTNMILNTM